MPSLNMVSGARTASSCSSPPSSPVAPSGSDRDKTRDRLQIVLSDPESTLFCLVARHSLSRHGTTPRHRNARKRARQQSLRCGAQLKRVSYISTTACSGLFIYEQQALISEKSISSHEHRRSYCAANASPIFMAVFSIHMHGQSALSHKRQVYHVTLRALRTVKWCLIELIWRPYAVVWA